MISKLRFSLIAVIMLVLLGFGFQNPAKGQIGDVFCPAVPNTTGWLETEIVGFGGSLPPDFTGSLIGTAENAGPGVAIGGLDWQHVDMTGYNTPTPTNETGSQLVSWWTQKDGRNTYLQVTNSSYEPVTVHVRIHNEGCLEIRDFCDTYTPHDTHEYNFGDLFRNTGQAVNDGNLQGVEGWVVITAVKDCELDSELAVPHNHLSGQLIVNDIADDYLYGVNTYARWGECFDETTLIDVNLIDNGDFEDGVLSPWSERQGNTGVISETGISPSVTPPDGDFMAYLASSQKEPSPFYQGGSASISDSTLISQAIETNVSVLESNSFTRTNASAATYLLSFLGPNKVPFDDDDDDGDLSGCENYAAALLVDLTDDHIEDADCYNFTGNGSISTQSGSKSCTEVSTDGEMYSISPFEFIGGKSSFIAGSLTIPDNGHTYVVQFVTGQMTNSENDLTCRNEELADTGALVDDVEVIEEEEVTVFCDDELTGAFNAYLDRIIPETLYGQFNILPGNVVAGADVVHINFADSYGPPYRPVPATSLVSVSIYDEDENGESCGDALVCFVRLGIDDALIPSEDFSPSTPTPVPPTATPTQGPTDIPTLPPTLGPTATPTGNGGGGSGSCSIAASPVQLGTALANVLIPLVPVAFAFGVRAVRRRKK